jgi:hypothetical protein
MAVAQVYWEEDEKKEGAREKKKEGGGRWRGVQGGLIPSRERRRAGGGEVDLQGASTQQLPELNDEDKAMFAKRPFDFSGFSSYFRTTLIFQDLMIQPCLDNSRKYPVAFLRYIRRTTCFVLSF